MLPDKSYLTASSLESITISGSDILKTIRSLDTNKAHGHDDISVRMMIICDDAIVEPLKMLFVNSVNQAVFPSRWKKANVIPVHKKNEKYIVNNYRPVSLLPTASKIFEKAIYHNLLNYIERENLNMNQFGFLANGSCINQLISITHEITVRSVVTHRSKLEVYSSIYPKPLMRFGTRDFYSNLNLLESVEVAQSSRRLSF